jgi:allantoicase
MDFTELIDLASERLGGAVLFANDEFFAPKENLLKPAAPIFIEGKYTDLGKWMDGWESRRRRTPGFDWCIVRLGLPGIIRGVVVDTSHFKGNYPEAGSLEACTIDGLPTTEQLVAESITWTEILPKSNLNGDSLNPFPITSDERWTHLRFKIFPDGWETKRRRGPGHDWTIIKLGAPGRIQRLEVDTSHFKGNFPESCSLEGCCAVGLPLETVQDPEFVWKGVMARTKLQAHTRHHFDEVVDIGAVSHVRLNIFPDGGVSRLRIYGTIE